VHHLHGTASKTKSHRPQWACSCPVNQIIELGENIIGCIVKAILLWYSWWRWGSWCTFLLHRTTRYAPNSCNPSTAKRRNYEKTKYGD
jgi:hypothetical protein